MVSFVLHILAYSISGLIFQKYPKKIIKYTLFDLNFVSNKSILVYLVGIESAETRLEIFE